MTILKPTFPFKPYFSLISNLCLDNGFLNVLPLVLIFVGWILSFLFFIKFEILPDIKARFGVDTNLSGLFEQEKDFLNDALIGFMLCLIGIYLALAWVFASWARPIVVMSIIPFGILYLKA